MEKDVRFRDWLIVAVHSKDLDDLKLETLSRPSMVGKHVVPEDLSGMTLGQMLDLQECKNGEDIFYRTCEVLLGMSRKEVDDAKAVEVVCFTGWVAGRIIWINSLFEGIKLSPTNEQVKAGIMKLNFGVFGMIDWYAKRMGITDHDDVLGVTWMRIYKCMEIDNKSEAFNRRLQKVYVDQSKIKK